MAKKKNNTFIWIAVIIAFIYLAGNQGFLGAIAAPEGDKDIMFVIDNSGSMYGNRIDSTQGALNNIIDTFHSPSVRAGLVAYATDATLEQPLTTNYASLKTKVNEMSVIGGTNLEQGILRARQELNSNGRADSVKIIYIISDGAPTRHSDPAIACRDADNQVITDPKTANDCTNKAGEQATLAKQEGAIVYMLTLNYAEPGSYLYNMFKNWVAYAGTTSSRYLDYLSNDEISVSRIEYLLDFSLDIGEAPACTVTSWSPSPSDTCTDKTLPQTSNCGTTRTVQGTKDCTAICGVPPSFTLKAVDKYDDTLSINQQHLYQINNGPLEIYSGKVDAEIGDVVKVVWGYGDSNYYNTYESYTISDCGLNDIKYTQLVKKGPLVMDCFNDEGLLINEATFLTLGVGGEFTMDCQMRLKNAKTGLPHGATLVLQPSGSNWDINSFDISGSVIGSQKDTLGWEINPISTTGNKAFDFKVKVKDGQSVGDSNIKMTLYSVDCNGNYQCTDEAGDIVAITNIRVDAVEQPPQCSVLRQTLTSDISKWISGTITRDQLGQSIMAWVNC